MAITSIGYLGKLDNAAWAKIAQYLGKPPLTSENGLQVTKVSGVDRTVRVSTGTAWGYGVLDVSDASVDVQLPTAPTLSYRWDTIVVKRTWGLTQATTITYRTGGTSPEVAGGLVVNPGVQVEQPIALVRVQAGTQVPTDVVDLRELFVFGGVRRFGSIAARDYWMTDPQIRELAYIADGYLLADTGLTEFYGSNHGNGVWRKYDTGTVPITTASGITAYSVSDVPSARREGSLVTLSGRFKRSNDADIFSTTVLGTIPAGFRPASPGFNGPCATAPKTDGSAALISISTAGVITPYLHVSVGWVSLDGISYYVD